MRQMISPDRRRGNVRQQRRVYKSREESWSETTPRIPTLLPTKFSVQCLHGFFTQNNEMYDQCLLNKVCVTCSNWRLYYHITII